MLKRTPLKRKSSHINRVSKKRQAEIIQSVSDGYKMWEMFESIWAVRPHKCDICGTPLGSTPKSYMFDHLLEKSKYPDLKYEPINIAVVCIDCHACKTNGFPKPKHLELINKIKELWGIT